MVNWTRLCDAKNGSSRGEQCKCTGARNLSRRSQERTKTWDKTIVNRERDLEEWVEACQKFNQRNIAVFAFANNHYAGHAPATVKLFWELWRKKK